MGKKKRTKKKEKEKNGFKASLRLGNFAQWSPHTKDDRHQAKKNC
jgi:hypothetical protein